MARTAIIEGVTVSFQGGTINDDCYGGSHFSETNVYFHCIIEFADFVMWYEMFFVSSPLIVIITSSTKEICIDLPETKNSLTTMINVRIKCNTNLLTSNTYLKF